MKIALYTLRSVAYALTEPYLVFMLLILIFVLYRQNKKTTVMQKMIVGEALNSPIELTASQVVIGILAGAAGSIILSYMGVVFDENSSVDLVFLISIILMLWSKRFMCFAYSGGILGLLSLIMDWIARTYSGTMVNVLGYNLDLKNLDFLKIDVVALMTMIAILHIIEGILVILDGRRGSIPVFTSRDERIIGGFAFQRQWVLPIAILILLSSSGGTIIGETAATPNWWPLVKTSIPPNILKEAVITLIPFYGVIGYSTVTFTKDKVEKTLISGISIIMYGGVLYALAQISTLSFLLKLFLVIFAPAAHEIMLNLQRYWEFKGSPKYISGEEGIMVLEVAPASPAAEMGIKSGDMLVEVNNKAVENEQDILDAVRQGATYIWLKVKTKGEKIKEVSYNRLNEKTKLGMVFVPKNIPTDSMVVKFNESRFQDVLDKIKKGNKEKDDE